MGVGARASYNTARRRRKQQNCSRCVHFSHSRPMAMPGSLRHMMRSGWCFAMA